MLIEFSVGNFRSFRDRVSFSMVAANIRSKFPDLDRNNTFEATSKLNLLKSAVIYGANASGKTNLMLAVRFANRFIVTSSKETQYMDAIPVEPFRLDTELRSEPSYFQFVFIRDGIQYRYGFEVDAQRVVSEWLYFVPSTKEARLFERVGDNYVISPRFKEGKGLQEKTRENALFLSVVAQFNGDISRSVINWFLTCNSISGLADIGIRDYTIQCLKNDKNKDQIIAFVKRLDLGIDDIVIEDSIVTEEQLPRNMPDKLKKAIIETTDTNKPIVKTYHRVKKRRGRGDGTGYEAFEMEAHESEGTKKLFSISGPLIDTLSNGKILFVDELDARLHPLITREIVRLFHSSSTNPKNAQLVFITHDTNLLTNRLFRRDQIWFAEKDRDGATYLASLVEYRVRNDSSFESDYIHGRYGAIPFLGNFTDVFSS